jgi:predicted dehydrogenase
MEDKVNIAVIGAGYWGKKVIREYVQLARSTPEVDLSMVCDLADENLTYCGEVLKVPEDKLAGDYRKALDSDDVNAVHICTPNETHYRICKEALKANKHVLLEKPMATEARHAWELVGIAKSRHTCLQVGHIFRFNNALRLMRELLAQEYLGQLYYLKLQWTTLMTAPLNRDIIFDLGTHPVDILNYLLNKWPVKVACKAKAYRRDKLEELAFLTLEFDNRLMAQVELSWLQPGKVREATITGSQGSAITDCADQTVKVFKNGNGKSFSLAVKPNNTILDEISHFAKSIMSNHNSNNTGLVGAQNVTVLEKLKRSLAQERTVRCRTRALNEEAHQTLFS